MRVPDELPDANADAEDTSAKVLVKKPIAAYVEQVYPYGNFAGLGIGV